MTTVSFLVEVTVERESGLFASRDEIAEKILDELDSAEDNVDLSGIGPNSDSSYTVDTFEIHELDKKERKALNQEYDLAVARDTPSVLAQRQIQKELKDANKILQSELRQARRQIEEMTEEREAKATRIYQDRIGTGLPPAYFEDGEYDRVCYQWGESFYDRFTVSLKGKDLVVRTETMSSDFVVLPRSANEVVLRMVER